MSATELPRLRIYRLKNAQRHVYAVARDERDAKELVLRRFDDIERWSVTYCGSQHDGKGRHRGLLEHDEVMRLFAAPPVPK